MSSSAFAVDQLRDAICRIDALLNHIGDHPVVYQGALAIRPIGPLTDLIPIYIHQLHTTLGTLCIPQSCITCAIKAYLRSICKRQPTRRKRFQVGQVWPPK